MREHWRAAPHDALGTPPCARTQERAPHLVGCACSRRASCPRVCARPSQEVLNMEFRRRLKLTIAVTALVAVVIPVTALAVAPGASADGTPTATASVVKVEH